MPLTEYQNPDEVNPSLPNDGELITREDGSQVIKVRKHKRRSKQLPKKRKAQTPPTIKWAIIILSSIFIFIPAAGTLVIIAKYNGGKFKAITEESIRQSTSAKEVRINNLKVTPISAKVKKAEINWDEHHFLNRSNFSDITAKLNAFSFLSNKWQGEEILAKSGSTYLQTSNNTATGASSSTETLNIYDFETLRCENLSLYFGEEKDAPSIQKIKTSIRNRNEESYKVFFRDGEVNITSWPLLQISSAVLSSSKQQLTIDSTIESQNNNGSIKIDGVINSDVSKPLNLNLKANNYPIQELLGNAIGQIIQGKIMSESGSLIYSYEKPPEEALNITLPFNSVEMNMGGLPMFQFLHEYTADTRYHNPTFNYCEGTLVRSLYETKLEDIKFISNNLMTIEGNIHIDVAGKIRGILSVTLPQRIFKKQAPASFRGPEDGYYTAAITLGGNIHSPHDNLSELMMSRSTQRNESPEKALSPFEEFEALTQ